MVTSLVGGGGVARSGRGRCGGVAQATCYPLPALSQPVPLSTCPLLRCPGPHAQIPSIQLVPGPASPVTQGHHVKPCSLTHLSLLLEATNVLPALRKPSWLDTHSKGHPEVHRGRICLEWHPQQQGRSRGLFPP